MASNTTDTALTSLTEAEESLRRLPKSAFVEVKSYAKPPLACLAVFEGVGILLEPSKESWEWTDDKKLLGANGAQFLERLFNLDKDQISSEQLKRLEPILSRADCHPAQLQKTSELSFALGAWLRAIVAYVTQKQQTGQ